MENTLYYGDNLDILKRYVGDESVDLIYLDPPFNSNQNYNVLFKERDGAQAASQIRAFKDTWSWVRESEETYAEVVMAGGKVADAMEAFRKLLGPCDLLAYLVMMAPRLIELRRALKSTGSIYLHCDPTASHYLKLLMDAAFGSDNFRNEIIWKRTSARSDSHRWNHIHDVIFFYSKSAAFLWNTQFLPYDESYVKKFYRFVEKETGRRYTSSDLMAAGTRRGSSGQPWRGIDPRARGNHWKYTIERLDELEAEDRIIWPKKPDGVPRFKRYLDEMAGAAIQSIIADIPPLSAVSAERLGYPTQKPVALLERIICASSNEGDVVLDPFCGCGTTVAAAQKLGRRWLGIDITHLAITLMKERLKDTFGTTAKFKVVGEPVSVPDAKSLAAADPYQFQWWALGLVGARPVEGKKGADKGIDGKIVFQGDAAGKFESVIFSVKAGHVTVNQVRDLRGVVERENAAIGVLISMESPTKPMQTEAVTAGFYESPMYNKKYPRLQLLTVADLLSGKQVDMPPLRQVGATFKKAPKAATKGVEQGELSLDKDED